MGEKYRLDRDESGLTAREREVIDLLSQPGMTLSGVGSQLGISKQRVAQIRKSAEAKTSTNVKE
jgi:DNA-directed RNA polymerase specialized sigma subunit